MNGIFLIVYRRPTFPVSVGKRDNWQPELLLFGLIGNAPMNFYAFYHNILIA